jgi:hypothetical protein
VGDFATNDGGGVSVGLDVGEGVLGVVAMKNSPCGCPVKIVVPEHVELPLQPWRSPKV